MSISKSSKLGQLVRLQGRLCFYCKRELHLWHRKRNPLAATVDHKLPKARGGSNNIVNCVAACLQCNGEKGPMTAEEYMSARNTADYRAALQAANARAQEISTTQNWRPWDITEDGFVESPRPA
jgi:5-methylcytosine-specific restriction endonuclease McrA